MKGTVEMKLISPSSQCSNIPYTQEEKTEGAKGRAKLLEVESSLSSSQMNLDLHSGWQTVPITADGNMNRLVSLMDRNPKMAAICTKTAGTLGKIWVQY